MRRGTRGFSSSIDCSAPPCGNGRTLASIVASGMLAWASFGSVTRAEDGSKPPVAIHQETPLAMRIRMPGKSHQGPLPALTATQAALRDALQRDVVRLAGGIGERNVREARNYALAAHFIERSLAKAGYQVQRQIFSADERECVNLEVELAGAGRAGEVIVLGAHYDSAQGTPGANDNATGVAALLALARSFVTTKPDRSLRFVFFANEEMPYFKTAKMGSVVYARRCKAREEKIVGMISLETMGYYSDAKNSQNYPPPFDLLYPTTGNFIGFVGNVKSRTLVETCVASFRRHARFPSEGGAIPGVVEGVGWSDHWSFWQVDYPALMVTDTAPFRYPHYHRASDTPDKVKYDRMARVVEGVQAVVRDIANPPAKLAEP